MSDFKPLPPSTNLLGNPVLANAPLKSLIKINDANVKIPDLGKPQFTKK